MYTNPIDCTQQFRFCGNPFRGDMYKGCDFGCKYCFANSRKTLYTDGWDEASLEDVQKLFKKALETDKKFSDANVELIRHRIPLHIGGMSDPFQKREWEKKLTLGLIDLSIKYNYPMTFSTKAAELPEEYLNKLDPKLHGIQVSIMGYDKDFIRKYETNTPTAEERLDFVRKLNAMGIWTSIRIQPLIKLDQAVKVVEAIKGETKYVTVEHLKIPCDNPAIAKIFSDSYNENQYYVPKHGGRNYEMIPAIKEENFKVVAEICNKYGVKVGCGDNDLHHLTQSRCCCGIDTIPGEEFSNYLKYNLTYFTTGEYDLEKIWTPKVNFSFPFNSASRLRDTGARTFIDWTKLYISKYPYLVYNSGKPNLLRDLFPSMAIQSTLFNLNATNLTLTGEEIVDEEE